MELRVRGLHRSGGTIGLLIWLLVGAAQAAGLSEQIISGEVILRRTSEGSQALIVQRAGHPRRAILADQSLAAVPLGTIGGRPALLIRGWSGGAYCCFTLHVMRRTNAGWAVIGSFGMGKDEDAEPVREGSILWFADADFDFWDMDVARATDLRIPVPHSLRNGRLAVDVAAMRRPVAEALGEACLTRGGAPPGSPSFTTWEEAASGLAAGAWGQDPRTRRSWRPEAEFARRALCLLYAGHGDAALRLLAAWPSDQPGRPETERQIIARLACTGVRSSLRALNGDAHPWLGANCGAVQADLQALYAAP